MHNNIEKFGGDPSQVIMYVIIYTPFLHNYRSPISWGESAGSISVALQMTLNGGDSEGLFHGVIMVIFTLFYLFSKHMLI